MPKIRTNSILSRNQSSKDGNHNNHLSNRSEQETIYNVDSSTFTKRSRIVSFENPQISSTQKKDVTSSFLASEFSSKTDKQSLSYSKKPRTLSRLSRSGCLKSMAQGLCKQSSTPSTVSDENLSSSDNDGEPNFNRRRSISDEVDNTSSTWGQFVDVVPVDADTRLRRRKYIRSRSKSFPNNLYCGTPYSLPTNRKNQLFKNDSYFNTNRHCNTSTTDQISDALFHMRV